MTQGFAGLSQMALNNGTAFRLSREIIDRKLAGQERVALSQAR